MIPLFIGLSAGPEVLDQILDNIGLKGCSISACVRRLDGTIVYERNGGLRLVPASNQKLFSAAFAADKLGADYVTETKFWRRPGRVVVDAPGDPLITYAQLRQIGVQLGVQKGEPILVRQAYRPGIGPGWEADDLANKYAAPVFAFTVDRGSYELWNANGKPEYRPYHYGAKATVAKRKGGLVRYNPSTGVASVRGPLPKAISRLDTLALVSPERAAALALGGKYEPTDRVPTDAPTYVYQSEPLRTMLTDCLVMSDNQLAEHLMLKAAGPFENEEVYPLAGERMKAFLVEKVKVDPTEVKPVDGSGLSRHNLATARSYSQLLAWARGQTWGREFDEWLVTPGKGTLRGRLDKVPFAGKTGTLSGVVSLSGYVKVGPDETLCVSVIVNGNMGPVKPVRDLVDLFMRKIAEEKLFGTEFVWRRKYEGNVPHPGATSASRNWLR